MSVAPTGNRKIARSDPKWGFVIFGVGLLVAVLWTLLANFSWTGSPLISPESEGFIALARSLLAGEGYLLWGEPTSQHMPGYPFFLAGVFALFGELTLGVGLVHSVFHAGSALILFFLGRRLYGERVGLLAGFIAALFPFYLFYAPFVLSETLIVFLGMLSLFFTYRAGEGRFWSFVWAGLVLGVMVLVRPTSLGLIPLMLLYLLWRGRKRLANVGLGVGATVLIVVLVLTPWIVHNWKLQGKLLLASPEIGQSLWRGTNPRASDYVGGYSDARNIAPLPHPVPQNISEVEKDSYYYRAFVEYVREHPTRFFALLPYKLVNMWRPTWEGSSAKNWVVLGAPYVGLMLLAFLGFSRARRNWEGSVLLFVFLSYWISIHLVFYSLLRYRLKAMSPLILFAALGLAVLWGWRSSATGGKLPQGGVDTGRHTP